MMRPPTERVLRATTGLQLLALRWEESRSVRVSEDEEEAILKSFEDHLRRIEEAVATMKRISRGS